MKPNQLILAMVTCALCFIARVEPAQASSFTIQDGDSIPVGARLVWKDSKSDLYQLDHTVKKFIKYPDGRTLEWGTTETTTFKSEIGQAGGITITSAIPLAAVGMGSFTGTIGDGSSGSETFAFADEAVVDNITRTAMFNITGTLSGTIGPPGSNVGAIAYAYSGTSSDVFASVNGEGLVLGAFSVIGSATNFSWTVNADLSGTFEFDSEELFFADSIFSQDPTTGAILPLRFTTHDVGSFQLEPMPEPTSLVLLVSGLVGTGARRWRKRERRSIPCVQVTPPASTASSLSSSAPDSEVSPSIGVRR